MRSPTTSDPTPIIHATARCTLHASPDRVAELLHAAPSADDFAHVQHIETLEPGARYRVHLPPGTPPLDIELFRGRDADGHPEIHRSIRGGVGLTLITWSVLPAAASTVVETTCTQFVENPVLHQRLALVKSELQRRLDETMHKLSARLASTTTPRSAPSTPTPTVVVRPSAQPHLVAAARS